MKKLIVFIVLVAAAVFGIGRFMLSQSNAKNFLASMDESMLQGDSEAACDRVHDDLEFSVTTNAGGGAGTESGGRQEFCDHLSKAAAMVRMMQGKAEIAISRDNFTVERDWKHPWTAHYTYTEDTTIRDSASGATMNLTSESSLTLVMTLTGVKIRKAESTITPAEGG